MIHILFIAFLISGFISEVDSIRMKETSNRVFFIYAAGSIFFLFWHEPYIGHPMIIGLGILSVISFLTVNQFPNTHRIFSKLDPYLSIALLILLSLYYILKLSSPS